MIKQEKFDRTGLPHDYFEESGYPPQLLELLDARVQTPEELTENEKLVPGDPQIIMVMGLQASGKSEVARRINTALDAPQEVFRTDGIRSSVLQKLFPDRAINTLTEKEIYSQEARATVYTEMFNQAVDKAHNGPVVLDATFCNIEQRDELAKLLHEKDPEEQIKLRCIYVFTDDTVAKKRIEKRYTKAHSKTGGGIGEELGLREAQWRHREREKTNYYPIFENYIAVDNSGSLEELDTQVNNIIKHS